MPAQLSSSSPHPTTSPECDARGAPRLEARLIEASPRAWAIVLRGGDEVLSGLTDFVKREGIRGGHLSAIGAFSSAELAFFDRDTRKYVSIPIADQVECLSLNGTIGRIATGDPMLHLHCTLGTRDGSMKGGHVIQAVVWPTLEVFLTESTAELPKTKDAESGLELFTFG